MRTWLRRSRSAMGPLWWFSSLYFVASRFGDAVNLYVSAFLVPACIAGDQMGAILPLAQFAGLLGLPLAIALQAAMKFIGVFADAGQLGKVRSLLRLLTRSVAGLAALMALVLWAGGGFIEHRLKVADPLVVWLAVGVSLATYLFSISLTAVRSLRRFDLMVGAILLIPAVRLAGSWLLMEPLQLRGYLIAQLASLAGAWFVLEIGIARRIGRHVAPESYRENYGEMLRYLAPTALTAVVGGLSAAAGPWVIRQRLPEADSAGYYMAALFGNMPLFVSSSVVPFLFPLVSERHERGDSTRRLHMEAMGVTLAVSLAAAAVLWFWGGDILALRGSWRIHAAYAGYIGPIAVLATLGGVVGCHIQHEMACRRFVFLRYYAPLSVFEAAGLYAVMGWQAFSDWLPAWAVGLLDRTRVHSLGFVIAFLVVTRTVLLACAVLETAVRRPAPTMRGPL